MEKGIIGSLLNQPASESAGTGRKDIELQVKVIPPRECPRCGNGVLHRHGTVSKRRVLDAFVDGRWIYLSWIPLRLRCTRCRKTFLCRPAGVRPWSRLTDRAIRTMVEYSRRMSYTSTAELLQLDRHRVRRVILKYVEPNILPEQGQPVVLTLDELSFSRHDYMCMAGELAPTRRVLSLLDNDLMRTIEGYLRYLKDSGVVVEGFVIDMKDSWRKAVKRVFPQAKVVVDPFHVVQDANRRLDECRKIEQEAYKTDIPRYPLLKPREKLTPKQVQQLEGVRRKFPALYELYQLKEELRDILRERDVERAREKIYWWLVAADTASNAEGRVWANTIRSWREEILNLIYFTAQGRRYTNGYIEGKITVAKMIKRVGFGFRNRQSFLKRAFIGCCPRSVIPQLLT